MQTFLPYSDFIEVALCLDNKRLGKQRVEAFQILKRLYGEGKGWFNHPAVLMWVGYEECLKSYYNIMVTEWVHRGFKNTMPIVPYSGFVVIPKWLGREDFHASHRSNLLRKNFEHYSKFGWKEPSNLSYIWPSKEEVHEVNA